MVARKSRFKALLGNEVAIVEFIPEEMVQPVLLFLAELPGLTEKILLAILAQPCWIHFGWKT